MVLAVIMTHLLHALRVSYIVPDAMHYTQNIASHSS